MASTDQVSTTTKSLELELLHHLARQARRVPIPIFLAAAMIAALAAGKVSVALWAGWLVLVMVMMTVRWVILGRLPSITSTPEKKRLQIAIALAALNGMIHGLSLVFFPYLSELERAIQSFLLIGLCTGAVATSAGYFPVFLAYMLPLMTTLTALWIASPGVARPGWVEYFTALIIVLFGVILVALAKDAFRLFRESFEIRLQHVKLNQQLQAALDQAESASRAKTRFLASASHDLRQPIHTLSLFAAALTMRPLDARSREISRHMDTALHALASQLDALLDVSKLDAGVVPVNRTPVRIGPFLQRMLDEFKPIAAQKGLEIRMECMLNAVVETDLILLERVLRNLLDNAIKYTHSGRVTLSATATKGQLILEVRDTGAGIPVLEQASVFEEFYQIENPERDRTRGLGLGLAIVKRLTDLLQIRMEMVSRPDHGTNFFLILPEVADIKRIRVEALEPDCPVADMHFLVIDDEVAVQRGMQTLLEGLGSRVTVADNTPQAVKLAQEDRPDVVLADFRLRGSDNGITAIQAIRQLYPEMPALLISGDTAPDRLQEAEEAGIRLLHKPVPITVLMRAIADAGNPITGSIS